MKPNPQSSLIFLFGILLLGACVPQPERVTTILATSAIPTNLPSPTKTRKAFPTPSSEPSQTPISLPSAAPTEEIPARSTPITEEFPTDYPLSIEYLREGEYPGSQIAVEQELDPGSNYRRYYVSYLSEGLKIHALMTIPNGETPETGWPVIIFNHGYIPPSSYHTTERYEKYVDEIARSGYIVFRSDYRGHDLSEGEARGAYGYPDYTIDILNAVASVKIYSEADPDRIGMWGHSMGGYITLRCMVISKDIKVGVIWAGVVAPYPDLVNNWPGQTYETPAIANNWRRSLVETYGSPAQSPVFWDAISANSYLTDLSGPIQLHHGTGDVEVPAEFSASLYQQLQVANLPAELYLYENDNHNLSNSFDLAMRRTIDFFDLYLMGHQ
jgi:pimeloyl-ACP methyl ester carboxylesterase